MSIRNKGIVSIFTVLTISFPVLTLFQNCSGQISAVMVQDELAGKLGVSENGIGSDSLPLGEPVPFEQPGAPVPPPLSMIEPSMPSDPVVLPEDPMPAPSKEEMNEPEPVVPKEVASMPAPAPESEKEESEDRSPASVSEPEKSDDRGPASVSEPLPPAPSPDPVMPPSNDDPAPQPAANDNPAPVPSSPSGPSISEEEEREIAAECSRAANNAESNNKNKKQVVSSNSLSGSNGKKIISRSNFNGNSNIDVIEDIHGHHIICDLNVRVLRNSSGTIILFKSNVQQIESVGGKLLRLGD